ncbi:uncharacterized protein F4817DRAFT_148413 [Daldinia loculata]|uniref:uncharacterized protein n=1 Tax=Daldinia loculata TaxID=103429 RepID=UPI0020C2B505|nr:uncharacterized protein F4817DRAFT_148413 [Daldinia loculata]KAI1646227.1 hypothetical protein F4817DRAFT_148413 [Daldinia loculata]
MDRTVQKGPRPHLPMTAEPQHGSLAQGSSSTPKHEKSSQGGDTTGNARSGNANGSKPLRRLFGSLGRQVSDKSGPNIPAAQRGSKSSEPEYEDVPLVPMTRGAHAGQPGPAKPAATKKTTTTKQACHDNQQGQSSIQRPQPQGRRAEGLLRGRVEATQAAPGGSESSEFTFRGGDTGNCVREPCGCCAYWINKICCGDDD